jgi:hypothetical protein
MKRDWIEPVFCCMVIESVMSQYCRFSSASGVILYLTFKEPK